MSKYVVIATRRSFGPGGKWMGYTVSVEDPDRKPSDVQPPFWCYGVLACESQQVAEGEQERAVARAWKYAHDLDKADKEAGDR